MSFVKQLARHGNPWSLEEEVSLRTAFSKGISVEAIAVHHQRTQGAIRGRLVKLGLMTADGVRIGPPCFAQPNTSASIGRENGQNFTKPELASAGSTKDTLLADELNELLDSFGASVRLRHAVASCAVETIADFARLRPRQILRIPGVGKCTVLEHQGIIEELAQLHAQRKRRLTAAFRG